MEHVIITTGMRHWHGLELSTEHRVGGRDLGWTGLGGVLSQSPPPPLLMQKPSMFQSPPENIHAYQCHVINQIGVSSLRNYLE